MKRTVDGVWMPQSTFDELDLYVKGLEAALKIARDEIEQSVKDRFWAINKEYLAKEHIEKHSVLKMIDRVLANSERTTESE